jgi:3-oxoadipate enol-lactonase
MTIIESKRFYLTEDRKDFIHFEVLRNVLPKTTVFIHGNLASNRWWYPSLDFAKLKTHPSLTGDVILAEIRGCGKSSSVDSAEVITIESLASEFKSFLLSLNLKSVNLVGHSTGGSISMVLATELTSLLDKVVLLDPVGPRGRRFGPRVMAAFESMKTDKNLVAEAMKATIHAPHINARFFSNVVVADAFRAAQNVGFKIAQAFGQFNIETNLNSIKSSVFILHGEEDQILPLKGSQDLAAQIAGARCEILMGKGHCPNLEDPPLFWNKTMGFLFPK